MIRSQRKARSWSPKVEWLEDRTLLSGSSGIHLLHASHGHRQHNGGGNPGGGNTGAEVFQVTLAPENNSGVSGTGTVVLQGDQLQVNLEVSGLEPNQVHAMHIHGFQDTAQDIVQNIQPGNRPSQVPPSSASQIPTRDSLGPNLVSELQAEYFTGPEFKDLTLGEGPIPNFPRADASGHISYHETLDTQSEDQTIRITGQDLARDSIEVHGAFVANPDSANPTLVHSNPNGTPPANAKYVDLLPVAVGLLTPVQGSGQTGSGSGGNQENSGPGNAGNIFTGGQDNGLGSAGQNTGGRHHRGHHHRG